MNLSENKKLIDFIYTRILDYINWFAPGETDRAKEVIKSKLEIGRVPYVEDKSLPEFISREIQKLEEKLWHEEGIKQYRKKELGFLNSILEDIK